MVNEHNQNPYEAPNSAIVVEKTAVDIDQLDVSDKWKGYFKAMQNLGGPAMPVLKTLPFKERQKEYKAAGAGFNTSTFLAFVFGSLYYIAKGMWKKAIVLWLIVAALTLVLIIALELVGLERFTTHGFAFVGSAIFMMMAPRDFYAFKVLNDKGWLPVKPW